MIPYIFIDRATNLTVCQEGGSKWNDALSIHQILCQRGFFYPGAFPTIVSNLCLLFNNKIDSASAGGGGVIME